MAETLGSLCDKLTIVKLKQWHTSYSERLHSLQTQEIQLIQEIDEFISNAIQGSIDFKKLVFPANKVYKENHPLKVIQGGIGEVFSQLAQANCALWHEQEKVYDIENVPVEQKDHLIKQLASLNLQRTACIDQIDKIFLEKLQKLNNQKEDSSASYS
jgi:hypothetical protein